jgi:hypothetical protein
MCDWSETRESSDSEAVDDEMLSCGSELLRWAEEVLRKAESQASTSPPPQTHLPPGDSDTSGQSRQSDDELSCKEQRAEELKQQVNRLQEQSERECLRMETETSRRQQLVEERSNAKEADLSGFRQRINTAAEEMRSNYFYLPFSPDPSAQNFERALPQRSPPPSMPPPQRPVPPPGGPSAPTTFRKAVYSSLAAAEARWAKLEALLESGATDPIHFSDIPWPDVKGSLTGIGPGDAAPIAKRKLVVALRRWHPDKWRRILDRVPEAEHGRVMQRVKSIAQRLLEEKATLAGVGRALP